MKTSRLIILAAVLSAASISARADFYTKVGGLYESPADLKIDNAAGFRARFKSDLGYTASVGYKGSLLREELEMQYFEDTSDRAYSANFNTLSMRGNCKQYDAFLNTYLDLPTYYGVTPYAGAGIGEARIFMDNLISTHGATNLVDLSGMTKAEVYQFMAGVQYRVFKKATVNLGYRFKHTGSFITRNYYTNTRQSVKTGMDRMLEVGLSWTF
jgi:opacity protein-like surface antigen